MGCNPVPAGDGSLPQGRSFSGEDVGAREGCILNPVLVFASILRSPMQDRVESCRRSGSDSDGTVRSRAADGTAVQVPREADALAHHRWAVDVKLTYRLPPRLSWRGPEASGWE